MLQSVSPFCGNRVTDRRKGKEKAEEKKEKIEEVTLFDKGSVAYATEPLLFVPVSTRFIYAWGTGSV